MPGATAPSLSAPGRKLGAVQFIIQIRTLGSKMKHNYISFEYLSTSGIRSAYTGQVEQFFFLKCDGIIKEIIIL